MLSNESTARVLDMKGEEIVPKEPKPKRAKAKAEEVEEKKLPEIESAKDGAEKLMKASVAVTKAKSRRKSLSDRYRDEVKRDTETLRAVITKTGDEECLAAALAMDGAEEALKAARSKFKATKTSFEETCGNAGGPVAKAFKSLQETLEERAEEKSKAAKAYRRAETKRDETVEAVQLFLGL